MDKKILLMSLVAVGLLGGLVIGHSQNNDNHTNEEDYGSHMNGMEHMMHGHMDGHTDGEMPCGMDKPLDKNGDGKCDHCGMPIDECPTDFYFPITFKSIMK